MSTTNIDEQKIIQKIESSDTIKDFMEKCNNNFSKIFEFGSGPEGKQGVEGSQGVPTKPKVPIHVLKKDEQNYTEKSNSEGEEFVLEIHGNELENDKYQDGHLILLENAHVYRLEVVNNSLTPKYILTIQSYDPSSVIDGKTAYVHIAFANSSDGKKEFTLSEKLNSNGDDEKYYTHMGIYSDCTENPVALPEMYTWVRIVGDTGEKGEKGEKGDTPTPPTSTNVEVVGYSLSADLELNSKEWKDYITDLGELKPGTYIYMLNKYTWSDGTTTYGKTVTMAGTQGIKGETGRVLFYLGSFSDGTLKEEPVKGLLNEDRCDYYIDANDQAWMRTGTKAEAEGFKNVEGGKQNNTNEWTKSKKIGFLQSGAIHADMINANTFIGSTVIANAVNAAEINAGNIKTGTISSKDEKSYFNLDNGEFVLGDANGSALEYKGGTLTIGGVNDDSADSILNRLGLAESSISDAAEALEDALKAIADEEKARTQAITNLETIQKSLQEQIDGEVTSWFLEGEPKNDNAPAKDWKTDELKQRHEGDTYTDITAFVSNETTPTAGQSWRWCNTDDEYGTGWHWHKIADNDATKALSEAAKAVAAADGKSKIFVVEPTNYQVGDLWILQSDIDHTAGKKGDILTANADSATYDKTHWSKEVKYTDDTAIDNLEIGGRNILSNTETMEDWTPGGYNGSTIEKYNINDFYGKNATQIISKGGTKKYKVIYDLLYWTNVDLNRQYTLSFNVKAIKHNLCIGCKLSKEKGNDIFFSNKIDIEAGVSKRVTFTGYPFGNEQNLQLWFGAADCDDSGDTESKYVANFYINELKLEYGNKATDWTPSTDEMDAKSLTYLKNALANDTNIAGGIIATSTIQLRDWTGENNSDGTKKYKVNSGLSGIDNDNVLMWGGGTYEEAANAALADNDFHVGENKTGRQITSLLKKDGQGKIGIFKISDTQAVVDVENKGKIIIDANEGEINIIDKKNNQKILITSKDINKDSIDFIHPKEEYSFNDFTVVHTKEGTQDSLVLETIALKQGVKYYPIFGDNVKFIYVNYAITYNSYYVISNIHLQFNIKIKPTQGKIRTIGEVNINKEISSSSYEGYLKIPFKVINLNITDPRYPTFSDSIDIGIYDAKATANVNGDNTNILFGIKKLWFGDGDVDGYGKGTTMDSFYLTTMHDQKTIIGNNGIQLQGIQGAMQILNSDDSNLSIRFQGLPKINDALEQGRLCYYDFSGQRLLVIKS